MLFRLFYNVYNKCFPSDHLIIKSSVNNEENHNFYNDISYIQSISKHANINEYNENKTFHLYENQIQSNQIREHITILKYGYIMKNIRDKHNEFYNSKYNIEPIDGMNELYISIIGGGGSDDVFETSHIDGPFFLLPFCKIYRCIVGITTNNTINTIFIHNKVEEYHILNKYEFLAFDYNRDIHYIKHIDNNNNNSVSPKNTEKRVVLKFHYIMYSKYVPYFYIYLCKNFHVNYNSFMRFLFLRSQNNKNKWLSKIINNGTIIFCKFMKYYN